MLDATSPAKAARAEPSAKADELKRYVAFGPGDEEALRDLHAAAEPRLPAIAEVWRQGARAEDVLCFVDGDFSDDPAQLPEHGRGLERVVGGVTRAQQRLAGAHARPRQLRQPDQASARKLAVVAHSSQA